MDRFPGARGLTRERIEVALAVGVVMLALLFTPGHTGLDRWVTGGLAEVLAFVLEIAILVGPGLLALTVLAGVLGHGWRLLWLMLGDETRRMAGDTAFSRVLLSAGLGWLAAYTLWWVIGSIYVMYIARVGGIPPSIVALLLGAILAVLVLFRAAFVYVCPRGPLARLRGAAVE